ncbi:tail fiber assembly protein [Caballeronia sp. LZ008]|uniref:tail fiber assembly protein n=1 Tax=unclassified Caballeronia TaxID=2646786 RepID=UPI002028030C|nr:MULTISPECIES: tail fiber assembly protein [unclassified Caballeronia]MDR5797263.1 tail fiber assembly protein [Caballeronia sp. LZ008]
MQYFIDQATGKPWAFEDNVSAAKNESGDYAFSYTVGDDPTIYQLDVPATLQPCTEEEAAAAALPKYTQEQILANNTATRDFLLSQAALAIAPLQDAVDLGEATDAETALLKLWKQYRIAVNRLDMTQASPAWPPAPVA